MVAVKGDMVVELFPLLPGAAEGVAPEGVVGAGDDDATGGVVALLAGFAVVGAGLLVTGVRGVLMGPA